MRGLPDWARSEIVDGCRVHATFDVDGVRLALPDALVLDAEPSGRPSFRLLAVRALGSAGGGRGGYGRLELQLRLTAGAATTDGAIRAVPPLRGWLWLRAALLDLPAELERPLPLDCSGLGLARLDLPLDAQGASYIEQATAHGALPLLIDARVEVAGIAPRVTGSAMVDLARLREAIAGADMTRALLAERILGDAPGMGVTPIAGAEDVSPDLFAEAVTDRVRATLCDGPLVPRRDGLCLRLRDDLPATGRSTLDLTETLVATRTVTLSLDPFAAARALAEAAGTELVTRIASQPLGSGRHAITVDDALPRPLSGPLAVVATLTFPARPPARMHEVREEFELPVDGAGVTRQVSLAPNEPLAWTLSSTVLWPAGARGVERLSGVDRACEGRQAVLRPNDLPLAFAQVEAGPALLALAEVVVVLAGERGGQPAEASATLSPDAPRAALAIPADAAASHLGATLTARDGRSTIPLANRPVADWRIELVDVPGYGLREMEIVVVLSPGLSLAAVELLPEDAGEADTPEVLAFSPARSARTHHWLCRDPFRPGLKWRWRGENAFAGPVLGSRLELTPEVAAA